MCTSGPQPQRQLNDMDLGNWFGSDSLSENLRTVVGRVILTPEPEVTPLNYSSDSDLDWEGSEAENEMSDISADGSTNVLMLEEGDWSAPPSGSDLMVLVPAAAGQAQDSPTYEQMSLPGSSSQTQVLALPPPSTSTSTFESGAENMAVAVPGDRSMVRIGQTGKLKI